MSLPKWLTPAGNLGIVPELEYYEFPLDAYDTAGGEIIFYRVSGRLPPGIQINTANDRLQGIPISTAGPDLNQTYTFTIRAENVITFTGSISAKVLTVTSVTAGTIQPGQIITGTDITTGTTILTQVSGTTGGVGTYTVDISQTIASTEITTTDGIVDRTFSLTITNVAPPVIVNKNIHLGTFFDGSLVDIQLTAVEFVVEDNLVWRLKGGELPTGVSITSDGLLTGYIRPVPAVGPSSDPDWDDSAWDLLPWDPPVGTTSKTYEFNIEVTDGVNYDVSNYTLYVYPRSAYKADSTLITADADTSIGDDLTTDTGSRHEPIITTMQSELYPQRADNYFQFNFDAIDLDGDVLEWTVPAISSGAFDEQLLTTSSIDYVAAIPDSGNLYAGAWPLATISDTAATMYLYSGNVITANVGDYITQTISGANARVTANVTNTDVIPILNINGTNFFTSRGNISLNGAEVVQSVGANVANILAPGGWNIIWSNVGVVPDSVSTGEPVVVLDYSEPNLTDGDTIQILYENPLTLQDTWYTATVNKHSSITLEGNAVVTATPGDYITQTISGANATVTAISATTGTLTISGNLMYSAVIGDVITQLGNTGTATVTGNVTNVNQIPVAYTSGVWTLGSGNLQINGSNVAVYPTNTVAKTNINIYYNTVYDFEVRSLDSTAIPSINGTSTNSQITSINSVGVTVGSLSTQGEVGFDEGRFDQGTLELPEGLTIQPETGWLTGILPAQTINEVTYNFSVVVGKRDYPGYTSDKLFSLTVLGDPNNTITWLTPTDLGTIENGKICDIDLKAISSRGKTLFYRYADNATIRLPQGLKLTSEGALIGRVSFEVFTIDAGECTIDGNDTTFDNTYTFTVTAEDSFTELSADRTFTIRVIPKNIKPYENLYLKALLSQDQRDLYTDLTLDQSIFPRTLIYRTEDPNFGVQAGIKTLFLPGLAPSSLEDYAVAASNNHFKKKLRFGEIKTAVAVDSSYDVIELATGNIIGTFRDDIGFVPTDFSQGYTPQATIPDRTVLDGEHTKYEVVYIEISDENTNSSGRGPADTIDLTGVIETPYYDVSGNSYVTAYPNAFSNMQDRMAGELGYANKGALPDWMTSRQPDGRVLGFTRAVVLAYTKAGESDRIAYRLKTSGFKFNQLDFTVDRYQVDNIYSDNFDIVNDTYYTSTETTFDRYPTVSSVFTDAGTVDYAINLPFESVNMRSVQSIRDLGGFDGIRGFRSGQRLVFAEQEFSQGIFLGDSYNQGWSDVETLWSGDDLWDWDANTATTSDDLGWDAAEYVTGYNEHNLDPTVPNRRIGVWEININADNLVELIFVQEIDFNDKLYVRNGYTYGGTNIYFDPVVKPNKLIPNYSIIPQEIQIVSTQFDGNGTRFLDYRDEYTVPESGDKYIKFAKTGVFT